MYLVPIVDVAVGGGGARRALTADRLDERQARVLLRPRRAVKVVLPPRPDRVHLRDRLALLDRAVGEVHAGEELGVVDRERGEKDLTVPGAARCRVWGVGCGVWGVGVGVGG